MNGTKKSYLKIMNKKKIKIFCVTGTRADYPRVKPVLKLLKKENLFDLRIIVTGQHLERKFGYTYNEIKKDKFNILGKVKIFNNDDTLLGMNKALSKCYLGISKIIKNNKPDLLLLTVDRIETLGAALAGLTNNIPIAHIQGGEVTGTLDETIRHCVTKMSHIHFPANTDARNRILKMGEDKAMTFNVGCPYIDYINKEKYYSKQKLSEILKVNLNTKFAIFTQHPVTSEINENYFNFKLSLNAIKKFKDINFICLFSNADAGGRKINDALKGAENMYIFKNLKEKIFLSLMSHASFMLGNSSAGIREAPSFRLPVINIGNRQNGRLRAKNVIDVTHNTNKIVSAIKFVLNDNSFKKMIKKINNPYGDGKASKKIVSKLKSIDIKNINIQKIYKDV